MRYSKSAGTILVPIFILLTSANSFITSKAQLSPNFYDTTCPNALSTIQASVNASVANNSRNAALLVRLHFHDCFVQGCDASLLLNDTGSERQSPANNGVIGYEVIDAIKAAVEGVCPGVVSCADILAVAARDASVAVNGPSWTVRLGRRDSNTSNATQAISDLPRGNMNLTELIANFARKNFTAREMVALSGSHTIGQSRCVRFRDRIYNSPNLNIDAAFNSSLSAICPQTGNDEVLQPLDLVTPNTFDNNYFQNLIASRGLLISDQVLFNGDSADSIVQEYVDNPATFNSDFAAAMVKMSEIEVVTGTSGFIRTTCSSAVTNGLLMLNTDDQNDQVMHQAS